MKNAKRRLTFSLSLLLSLGMLMSGCSSTGATGPQGPQGAPGVAGKDGKDGVNGKDGKDGKDATGYSAEYTASPEITEGKYKGKDGRGNFSYKGTYYTDYSSLAEAQEAAHSLAVDVAAEGDVLLKNDDCLPLTMNSPKVTLFGIRTVKMNRSGYGSGSGGGSATSNLLSDSLTAAGYRVNPKTVELYNEHINDVAEQFIREIDMGYYGSSITSTYNAYGDAAIVTFSRTGQENADCATNNVAGHANQDDHYLQLDDNEKALIHHVKKSFKKVIVLINSSNIMQIPDLAEKRTDDNLGVDAILWVGSVGQDGCTAIAHILNGDITPSGHTSDLWEKDFTKGPTFSNFGMNSQMKDANGNRLDPFYYDSKGNITKFATVEYREGIYSGYRYYETAYADADGDAAKKAAYSNVLYPFGYGLSYTTFDWKIDNVKDADTITSPDQTITMRVWVKNTGSVAGKDVVQVYYSAPYTKGGIEKSATNLVGFAKTKLLQPGQADYVTVKFAAQDMASFDWNDANKNGFKGYELEKGDYKITINHNSHDVVGSVTRTITNDIQCKTDLDTGKEIKPVYTGSFSSVNDSLLNHMISRSTGLKQPAASSKADRTLTDATLADYESQATYRSYMDKETDPWYVKTLPSTWDQETDGTKAITIPLSEMSGVPYTEPTIDENNKVVLATDDNSQKWEQFMNQFTWDELTQMPSSPNNIIARLGIKYTTTGWGGTRIGTSYGDPDGPINAGGVQFPSNPILAATYNQEIAHKVGTMVGNLLLLNGSRGWRGAGADIHRSPFSGRNFEYYSEDGVHSGLIGCQVADGVTSKGIIAHFKHFFGNDQETFRADYGGVFTWATEQTLREITAKPFEYIIKRGGTLGLMDSFNRIGKWTQSTNYATHELLLNQEWDFQGECEGDAWAKQFVPLDLAVRGGDDQLLSNDASYPECAMERGHWDATAKCVRVAANADEFQGYDAKVGTMLSPTHYFAVRKCAQRQLQVLANSSANNNGFLSTGEGTKVTYTLTKGIYNSIRLAIPGKTNDVAFTFADDVVWPTGMSYDAKTGVLSGIPTEVPGTVAGTFDCDAWIKNMNATFSFNLQSDLMVDGAHIVDGKNIALTKGKAVTVKADSLAYGNQLKIDKNSNQIIRNAYVSKVDGNWYHRDEDKSAADIITLGDFKNADLENSKIYSIEATGLPAGFEVKQGTTQEDGYATGRGKYDVNTYLTITAGNDVAAGNYTATITLNVPYLDKGTNPWITASRTKMIAYTQTVTFTIA